uniref:Uncharacterized protein n=1 Tax=Rhizophora mucronata TaxID=61149 RepID=A0A2P2M0F4_RHIMU
MLNTSIIGFPSFYYNLELTIPFSDLKSTTFLESCHQLYSITAQGNKIIGKHVLAHKTNKEQRAGKALQ